jgi:hypothetical protein
MSQILDKPPLGLDLTLDEELLGGYGNFPDRLFLISVGDGKYACNNATLTDGQSINGLSCFPSAEDGVSYMAAPEGLKGELVGKSFEEARQIAISKPILVAIFLFSRNRIVDVHFVR